MTGQFRAALLLVTSVAFVMLGSPALANGDGDTVGVVDQTSGIWYLRDPSNGATTSFYYGNPGDFPVAGDWNGDGIDTPGLYRQSDGFVYLRLSNTQGNANIKFFFGNPGDVPLAGDFNGDGRDTISIWRPHEARVYVINELGENNGGLGAADFFFDFGNPADEPFVADFNGNGVDSVGLHRESTGLVYYRNSLTTGIAEESFIYGDPGHKIIAGDWAQKPASGQETVGIFRPLNGTFYLRFTNSQGNANTQFVYGNLNVLPVAATSELSPAVTRLRRDRSSAKPRRSPTLLTVTPSTSASGTPLIGFGSSASTLPSAGSVISTKPPTVSPR